MNKRHIQQTTKKAVCWVCLFVFSTFLLAGVDICASYETKVIQMTITEEQLEAWILTLIKQNRLDKFYKWHEWRELSEQIKKENNYECQLCKKRGLHSPARSVHHVQWVRKHPRLAMSRTYWFEGKEYINLIPLCESCHNEQHPEKGVRNTPNKERFVNEERW